MEYYVDTSDSDVDEPYVLEPKKQKQSRREERPDTDEKDVLRPSKKSRYFGVFGDDEEDADVLSPGPTKFDWKRKAQTDPKALERERARATRNIVRERMDENHRQMLMRAVFG